MKLEFKFEDIAGACPDHNGDVRLLERINTRLKQMLMEAPVKATVREIQSFAVLVEFDKAQKYEWQRKLFSHAKCHYRQLRRLKPKRETRRMWVRRDWWSVDETSDYHTTLPPELPEENPDAWIEFVEVRPKRGTEIHEGGLKP